VIFLGAQNAALGELTRGNRRCACLICRGIIFLNMLQNGAAQLEYLQMFEHVNVVQGFIFIRCWKYTGGKSEREHWMWNFMQKA
jgi:hypothetical protein